MQGTKVRELFDKHFVLPVHRGRAAENIIGQTFVKPGDHIPKVLRFFLGRLKPCSDWPEKLTAKFRKDSGDRL